MAQGKYERELRDILEGDEEAIADATKTTDGYVTEQYERFKDNPFLVSRGAGSLGVDLLAVRGPISLMIEVKSSKDSTIYLSDQKRLQEQREDIERTAKQCQVVPLYAYRLKGRRGQKWKLFTLDIYDDLNPPVREIMTVIPTLTPTKTSYKIVWDEGKWLGDFTGVCDGFLSEVRE